MADRIQFRRDTKANWERVNPILLEGEVGYVIDTKQKKIGDGVHHWNDLDFEGINIASINNIGGIKAKPKTSEDTQEVHISEDGFLFTKTIKDPNTNPDSTDNCKLHLPNIIRWEVGKPLYIFKNSIISAYNYKNYNVQVLASNDASNGKDYNRYYMYKPTTEGNSVLTFNLYDNNHILLDTKNVTLMVKKLKAPSLQTNVLFIGDSLTFYNRITDEFIRVLTSSSLASEVKDTLSIYNVLKPSGRGLSNINLIGTQKQNYKGWVGATKHEGYSGWEWSNFIQQGSPFFIGGKLNFTQYLSNNGFATPDVIYIGLGWNDSRNVTLVNGEWNVQSIYNNAKTFLTALTTQLPNVKVRLWTENVPGTRGGIGNHPYGAVEWADEHRLKLIQLAIAEMYKTLVNEFANVELVWATAMIDSEFGLQESLSPINSRIADTEVLGVDYVHPADSAFFQIADALISDFTHCISGTDVPIPSGDGAYTSAYGQTILDYQGTLKLFSSTTLEGSKSAIRGLDVSANVGKYAKITAAQSVIQGAYYGFFLSELPSVVPTLKSLSGATFANQVNFVPENRDIIVSAFNVSTSDGISNTVSYKIPEGAKYLFYANLYANEPNSSVIITDTGEDVPEINDLQIYSTNVQKQTILDYQGVLKLFSSDALIPNLSTVYGIDVSKYKGKAVKITAAQSVIEGAYYGLFLSGLPSALNNLSDLPSNTFATSDVVVPEDRSIIVGRFNVSNVNEVANTVAYNIPDGAKYLFFANLNKVQYATVEIVDYGIDVPTVDDTTESALYKSAKGNVILNYQDVFRPLSSLSLPNAEICGINVSGLIGKTIRITAAQNVIDGAYYSFFTNALPSTINSIESLEGAAFADGNTAAAENQSLIVEQFNVSTTDLVSNTVTKVIPSDARYLLFTNQSNIASAYVEVVE